MKLKDLCTSLAANTSSSSNSDNDADDRPPRTLQLTSCSDADDYLDAFLEAFRRSHSRSPGLLVRTDFLTSMTDDNVGRFFRGLGTLSGCLEELTVQSSSRFHVEEIPPLGLLSLRQVPTLRTLGLDDLQVTATQTAFIAGLAKAIHQHPGLVTVNLRNFFANDWANTEADVLDPLLEALGTLPNVQHLELSGCGSHALSGQDVRLLSTHALAVVVGLPTLKHLELSFLELDDDHFATIAECLKKNDCSLESLHLDYHKLDRDGFRFMMEALETNRLIKTLSLRSLREIGDEGFDQAMNTLQLNYGIKALSITASPSQQAQIDLYLRMNDAGRGRLREPKASLSEWVDVIAKSSDDVDLVRHLLQEIPELCNTAAAAVSTGTEESDPRTRSPTTVAIKTK